MNEKTQDEEMPDYLLEAIESGKVVIDKTAKTATLFVVAAPNNLADNSERQAAAFILEIRDVHGLKARLEHLGYTVEVIAK